MAGAIIWCVCVLGCAVLFCGIGVYAERSEKPMHFWSGSEVKPEEISDIPSYNRENARMWWITLTDSEKSRTWMALTTDPISGPFGIAGNFGRRYLPMHESWIWIIPRIAEP